MSRQVETGSLVIDSFPVFEDDGYTAHSGLVPADFVIQTFVDGLEIAVPVSISEIGTTGNYEIEFTPTVDGLYQIQIHALYNDDIWGETYEAGAGFPSAALVHIRNQVDKIDIAPTLGPATVTSGSLMDRTMNKDSAKTYNQGTDSLEALRDRVG
jgi:hypothetical protein